MYYYSVLSYVQNHNVPSHRESTAASTEEKAIINFFTDEQTHIQTKRQLNIVLLSSSELPQKITSF